MNMLGRPSQPVVLAGEEPLGDAWEALCVRSSRLPLLARAVERLSGAPGALGFEEVLERFPHASVLVARPPRGALSAALQLAQAGRRGLVAGPVHTQGLCDARLPAGADAVFVAFGWTTLAGVGFVEQWCAREMPRQVAIDVGGEPDEWSVDAEGCVQQALALVHRLFPGARLVHAEGDEQTRRARFVLGKTTIALQVAAGASRLALRLEGNGVFEWRATEEVERFSVGGRTARAPAERPVRPSAERALSALWKPDGAVSLRDARQVAEWTQRLLAVEPSWPVLPRFSLAARLAHGRPDDVGARLGFAGKWPSAPALSAHTEEPLAAELWAFRAGLKPVAFMTLAPEAIDETLARFSALHVERRERRVRIGPQDHWDDRRDVGEVRVELYLSNDPTLAREAAELQTLSDPSLEIRRLGELMGYPACCVEAFARQSDRANNTRNRYETAFRTRGNWAWELNNLAQAPVPFFPCRYDCAHALQWSRRALAERVRASGSIDDIQKSLSMPVLYFAHDEFVVFDGVCDSTSSVEYRHVRVAQAASAAFRRWAGAFALGNSMRLNDEALTVERDGVLLARLERTDPGLGFLAPFSTREVGQRSELPQRPLSRFASPANREGGLCDKPTGSEED